MIIITIYLTTLLRIFTFIIITRFINMPRGQLLRAIMLVGLRYIVDASLHILRPELSLRAGGADGRVVQNKSGEGFQRHIKSLRGQPIIYAILCYGYHTKILPT